MYTLDVTENMNVSIVAKSTISIAIESIHSYLQWSERAWHHGENATSAVKSYRLSCFW